MVFHADVKADVDDCAEVDDDDPFENLLIPAWYMVLQNRNFNHMATIEISWTPLLGRQNFTLFD